jgi:hypothetical protein
MVKRVIVSLVLIWGLSAIVFLLNNRTGSAVAGSYGIDAEKDGPIYGDPLGLARVAVLESELHQMDVRSDHPRIFLTKDNLQEIRDRCLEYDHPSWEWIKTSASQGNMVHAAFAYLITGNQSYLNTALTKMKQVTTKEYQCEVDHGGHDSFGQGAYLTPSTEVIELAVAFDLVFDALSQADKNDFIAYIARNACLDQWNYRGTTLKDLPFADRIDEEASLMDELKIGKVTGEVWHGDAMAYGAQDRIPSIVLAGHYTGAEELYLAQWDYDSKWGDSFRYFAYASDGIQANGYSWAGMVEWALYLKNATGVNVLDDPRWPFFPNMGLYFLYESDLAAKREIDHYGQGHVPVQAYEGPGSPFSPLRTDVYSAAVGNNPYHYWLLDQIGAYYEITYFADDNLYPLVETAIYNPTVTPKNPTTATWEELPTSMLFGGTGQVTMRTDWTGDSAVAIVRSGPTLNISSHGGEFVGNFALYRKGVLSPEAGSWWNGFIEMSMDGRNNIFVGPEEYGSEYGLRHGADGIQARVTFSYGMPYRDTPLIHDEIAWQGRIAAYEASPDYTYSLVDVNEDAYNTATTELDRNFVFIPKGSKAYYVIFDRVESQTPQPKHFRMWLVSVPEISGNKVSVEVPGHIETYDGDYLKANNAFNTAAVYLKSLLPQARNIRWIGGDDYEWYFQAEDTNYIPYYGEDMRLYAQEFMGAPPGQQPNWRELGFGRVDISPAQTNKRDLFLNVLYMGDANETMAPVELKTSAGGGSMYGAYIKDSSEPWFVLFSSQKTTVDRVSYTLDGNNTVQQLICDLPVNSDVQILVNGQVLKNGQTSSEGTLYFTHNPNGSSAYEVVVGDPLDREDINHDGKIDYLDVELAVSVVLGFKSDPADVNGDGLVNARDIQQIINAIQ